MLQTLEIQFWFSLHAAMHGTDGDGQKVHSGMVHVASGFRHCRIAYFAGMALCVLSLNTGHITQLTLHGYTASMGQVSDHQEFEAYPFLENKLIVVASPNHPLARKPSISLARLIKERFLVREAGSGTRLATDHLLAEHGLTINPYMELGSSEAIKLAVMAGLGLSVLSINNLRLELAGGHVAMLSVEGFPLERHWYAVHLKGKKLSLVTRTFLDFLLRQGKNVLKHNIPMGQPDTDQVRST